MPWYVFVIIGFMIFSCTAYLFYAVEGKTIQPTLGAWLFIVIIDALEAWALIHLALHAH